MNRRVYIVLKLCAVALLLCLLFSTFDKLDIAKTKNDQLTIAEQKKIEAVKDINELKLKAKSYLTNSRENHKKESSQATINILLICGILGIEILLWFKGGKRFTIIQDK